MSPVAEVAPQTASPGALDSANHVLEGGKPVPGPYVASTTGLAAGGYRGTPRALTVRTAKLDGKYSDADMDRMGWGLRPPPSRSRCPRSRPGGFEGVLVCSCAGVRAHRTSRRPATLTAIL